jgi:signal transduction histidine kinase
VSTPLTATLLYASQPEEREDLPTSQTMHNHTVQFYENDAFLVEAVSDFAEEGLGMGEPLLLVATELHSQNILGQLRSGGVDVDSACTAGQIVVLDARRTLSSLMINGMPDRERFQAIIGEMIQKSASRGCHVRVRAYGEMVDLLWRDGNPRGAIGLEELWNELMRTHPFALLCSYRMSGFGHGSDAHTFREICQAHAQVRPAESYLQLEGTEEGLREISRLQHRAQALENEIQHRRHAEQALREAIQVREDFLSMAGHDLKTPLTALMLKVQTLLREARAQPESVFARKVRDDSEAAVKQIKRLSHLVNELLDASRLAAGRFTFQLEDLDLSEVVRDVVSRFDGSGANERAELIVQTGTRVLVRADRLRVEQVITNLVENALKYGMQKPVHVSCERDGTMAILAVKDQGIGIDPRDQSRIFERFERAVSERAFSGLGLGLFITRTVVEALGGTVRVQSELGKGATFTVSLPLASPTPAPVAVRRNT